MFGEQFLFRKLLGFVNVIDDVCDSVHEDDNMMMMMT